MKNIVLKEIKEPLKDCSLEPVNITDETMIYRKEKLIELMKKEGYKQLIIYGDVEHGSNFEYLVGFFTRFEEALAILDDQGNLNLILGNENLNKANKARFENQAYLCSDFSLPNQPLLSDLTLKDCLVMSNLKSNQKTGVCGWKLFNVEHSKKIDVPKFIFDAIKEAIGSEELVFNATDLFIGKNGVRNTNNANEIAHYEFGAALASDCVLDAMNEVDLDKTEMNVADKLVRFGQHTSIVTICSNGPRFIKGNMYPTHNKIKLGEPMSITVGYRGGSSSRAAVTVYDESELKESQKDYLTKVVVPYFNAYVVWLEKLKVGSVGGDVFKKINEVLPKKIYGWSLCPGHLTAEEEWSASPIYENSEETLRSGMILQIDIIPSVAGYPGTCAESTVVLANEDLRKQLKEEYPDLYRRMMVRKEYIVKSLGINLSDDILPMCSTVGYLRPYLLNKKACLVVEE